MSIIQRDSSATSPSGVGKDGGIHNRHRSIGDSNSTTIPTCLISLHSGIVDIQLAVDHEHSASLSRRVVQQIHSIKLQIGCAGSTDRTTILCCRISALKRNVTDVHFSG